MVCIGFIIVFLESDAKNPAVTRQFASAGTITRKQWRSGFRAGKNLSGIDLDQQQTLLFPPPVWRRLLVVYGTPQGNCSGGAERTAE
jgi:hypothetical protein